MHNSIDVHWWGVELTLDEPTTQTLLTLIDTGGDVVGLMTLIDPEMKSRFALGLAAALSKIGAKVIKTVDEANGRKGVRISHPWVGPVPGWVSSPVE